MPEANTYREAGVDLEAANKSMSAVSSVITETFNPEVLSPFGGFGGIIRIPQDIPNPVIVSSVDSVGTKVSVAVQNNTLHTVGADIVHHCVNDILVAGAEPLCFMDYVAHADFTADQTAEAIRGVALACRALNIPLVAGETAQLPGIYRRGEFDLVGAVVGIADETNLLDIDNVKPGDVVVALPSNGLHTNGFSLARRIFADIPLESILPELGRPLAEELLAPHRCYLNDLRGFLSRIHALAHITGGGLLDNIPRSLPDGVRVDLEWGTWQVPAIFELIRAMGEVQEDEMAHIFNMGIGMAAICPLDTADELVKEVPGASIAGNVQASQVEEKIRILR
jgi:phosphoribosylformylglycinamidine cyclo-ligase